MVFGTFALIGVLMVVTNVPRAIKVKRGGTVSFGCTAFSTNRLFAEDIAQVGWLVRSSNHQTSSQLRPVMSLPNVEVQQGSEKSPFGSVIWGNAEVTITNFNEEHVGFYVCRAQGDQKHSPSGHRMQAAVKLRLDGPSKTEFDLFTDAHDFGRFITTRSIFT